MRADIERNSMDIEQRDIEYILPAYIRLYLFQSKNADPAVITFPMFKSVPHPFKAGVRIPITFVPEMSEIAVEIAKDGSDIPLATKESETAADKTESDYNIMKKRLDELEAENTQLKAPGQAGQGGNAKLSKAKAAFAVTEQAGSSAIAGVDEAHQPSAARVAKVKQPEHPLPPGTTADYGGRRDNRDLINTARDLAEEKDIKEDEERDDNSLVERVKKTQDKK